MKKRRLKEGASIFADKNKTNQDPIFSCSENPRLERGSHRRSVILVKKISIACDSKQFLVRKK